MRTRVRFVVLATFLTIIALPLALSASSNVTHADNPITQLTFHWSYQPNGTTDFTSGTSAGSIALRLNDGVNLDTGDQSSGAQSDVYYCDPNCSAGSIQGFWSNNGLGGVHDLGALTFESVTSAPDKSMGLGEFQFYNNQGVLAQVGHVYAVVTRDGNHYAKLIIDGIGPAPLLIQGDTDCSGNVTPVDALAVLAYLTGATPLAQTESCPNIAAQFRAQGYSNVWSDINCSFQVESDDAIAQLRFLASLPIQQQLPCRAIETEFPFVP